MDVLFWGRITPLEPPLCSDLAQRPPLALLSQKAAPCQLENHFFYPFVIRVAGLRVGENFMDDYPSPRGGLGPGAEHLQHPVVQHWSLGDAAAGGFPWGRGDAELGTRFCAPPCGRGRGAGVSAPHRGWGGGSWGRLPPAPLSKAALWGLLGGFGQRVRVTSCGGGSSAGLCSDAAATAEAARPFRLKPGPAVGRGDHLGLKPGLPGHCCEVSPLIDSFFSFSSVA